MIFSKCMAKVNPTRNKTPNPYMHDPSEKKLMSEQKLYDRCSPAYEMYNGYHEKGSCNHDNSLSLVHPLFTNMHLLQKLTTSLPISISDLRVCTLHSQIKKIIRINGVKIILTWKTSKKNLDDISLMQVLAKGVKFCWTTKIALGTFSDFIILV